MIIQRVNFLICVRHELTEVQIAALAKRITIASLVQQRVLGRSPTVAAAAQRLVMDGALQLPGNLMERQVDALGQAGRAILERTANLAPAAAHTKVGWKQQVRPLLLDTNAPEKTRQVQRCATNVVAS